MKRFRAVVVQRGVVLPTLCVLLSVSLVADTGKDLFRHRCAECHGRAGKGKSKAGAPNLRSAKIKSMSDGELREIISQRANGEMEKKSTHTLLKKRLSADQVDMIVGYVRELQSN